VGDAVSAVMVGRVATVNTVKENYGDNLTVDAAAIFLN
jgi:hypothetical protein